MLQANVWFRLRFLNFKKVFYCTDLLCEKNKTRALYIKKKIMHGFPLGSNGKKAEPWTRISLRSPMHWIYCLCYKNTIGMYIFLKLLAGIFPPPLSNFKFLTIKNTHSNFFHSFRWQGFINEHHEWCSFSNYCKVDGFVGELTELWQIFLIRVFLPEHFLVRYFKDFTNKFK